MPDIKYIVQERHRDGTILGYFLRMAEDYGPGKHVNACLTDCYKFDTVPEAQGVCNELQAVALQSFEQHEFAVIPRDIEPRLREVEISVPAASHPDDYHIVRTRTLGVMLGDNCNRLAYLREACFDTWMKHEGYIWASQHWDRSTFGFPQSQGTPWHQR